MANAAAAPSPAASSPATPIPAINPPPGNGRRRRHALGRLALAGLLAVAAAVAYWALVLRGVATTDNAYVQGNLVQITPQVGGTVVAILADEADTVQAGQPLVRLDAADARLARDQAAAQLAQAVRESRALYAGHAGLAATISQREAELKRAVGEVRRADDDLRRRAPLVASGAVGQEDLAHASARLADARSAQAAAESALRVAREALATRQSLTEGIGVAAQPAVLQAAGRLREAYIALQRTELPAPLAGVVARRSVQIGQRVAAGTPLMALVALDQLWVEANFKESQLRQLRIGQRATLVADVYGRQVQYAGRVAGLGAGTGAAFALLPAQNATGNWIKIVQRVPVRIALDPEALKAHPLRVGLSMTVSVDLSGDGAAPPQATPLRAAPVAQTAVFDRLAADADAEVARVIRSNLGPAGARR